MPTANTISLQNLIYQQALASGVPPQIALAVAQKESSTSQWTQNGDLVTGTSGEVGVFQLMPGTAAGLGVDPSDVNQNIQGGVSFLAQLFQKYGDWAKALSAYNSGSPTGSPGYANSVLSIANGMALPSSPSDVTGALSGDSGAPAPAGSGIPLTVVAGAALGAVGLILWALD